jgi:formylglycine-generating enzyme required for sulfatase activity
MVVKGGGLNETMPVRLTPSYAAVTVLSVPAGAAVSVDGKRIGVTPLTADVDAGRRELSIAHPQFRAWESPITVKAGEPLKVGPVELGLPDGTLVVRSEPGAADVSVGGRYRGRTPVTLALAPGIGHEIVVTRAGYAPATRTMRVESRQQQVLALKLEAVLGDVTVRGEPADAELFVDGVSRGAANQSLRLPAAPHAIEVRRPGLETFRTTITPRVGLAQVVEYSLKAAEQQRIARISTTARTSLGQELRLITAGRYMMGSTRREPGRRSNESQRTVELKRPFYIGTREVTNREFQEYQKEHRSGIFKQETLDLDRQPVVSVSWQQAAAFCNWLSAKDGLPQAYVQKGSRLVLAEPANTGYRLPTEAEWEYVARFDGASPRLKYPWGMELPVAPRSGNYADRTANYLTAVTLGDYDDGYRVAAPVGSFAPNALGIYDLGGNVAEWTNDLYSIYVVAPEQVVVDPTGPADGEVHVVRGSSWMTGKVSDLRLAFRDFSGPARQDLGFRIARYAE